MDLTTDRAARAGRRELIGLAVLGLPTVLVALDMSVLYLALPHLAGSLGASSVQQLWITDVYGFVLAGLLVTMGTLGDRIGRKRLLLIGGVCFAAASVLAAFSTSPEMLIASRALLGVAGSTIMPSTMALITVLFPDAKQQAMAIAVWMGCFMGGTALGPLVGGALLELFWWGSVFLLGVPVMALLLIFGPKLLPEYREPAAGRIDPVSVLLSMAAVLSLVYGLKQLARDGAGPGQFAALAAGLAVGVVFLRRQRRLTSPLLELGLFKNRTFRTGLLLTLASGLVGANQLFVSFYLQSVEGLSPVATALWLLPSVASMVVVIQLATLLIRRVRPAAVIAGGLVVAVAGYLLLTLLDGGGDLPLTITALVLANLGIGPMAGLCATLAMQSVPPERAGSAASLTETAGEFGVAMGVVTVGLFGSALYQARIETGPAVPPAAAEAARDSVGGAMAAAGQLPPAEAATLLRSAYQAVTSGLQGSAAVCAGIAAAAVLLVLTGIRHLPPSGRPETGAETGKAEEAAVGG
ncbi:MFS transporter [Amycolatopsis nigrescens]|uniref:MFS transporter n=1 Tax=Amycolatopsis nigrescens TaxID=381445 RepID=UPI00037ECA9D|nr:MFS transporter [Amycolatopsis nigrescens]